MYILSNINSIYTCLATYANGRGSGNLTYQLSAIGLT